MTKQPISRQTYWRGVAPKLCSLAPGWLYFWDTVIEFNINNEFIIYIACSPQGDCILLFRHHQLLFDPLRNQNLCPCGVILVVRSSRVERSREKHRHFSLYVQNISGYRENKRRNLIYQNKISFQISIFDRSKIIVNQTE